jgi:hypothetical protein
MTLVVTQRVFAPRSEESSADTHTPGVPTCAGSKGAVWHRDRVRRFGRPREKAVA